MWGWPKLWNAITEKAMGATAPKKTFPLSFDTTNTGEHVHVNTDTLTFVCAHGH